MRPVSSATVMKSTGSTTWPSAPDPAHERLETADLGRFQIHDRLEVHRQLVAFDAAAELGFEREPLQRRGVHDRVEQLIPAAAGGLGAIHRDVGVAQDVVDHGVLPLAHDDADAGGGVELAPLHRKRCDHRRLQPVGDRADLLGDGDVVDQHGELVAAEPRQHVARAHLRLQPLGERDQELVAGEVAQAVVDQLEAVEVDEQDGVARFRRAGGLSNRPLQQLAEHRAVGQTGQRVVPCGARQRFLCPA